jgi:hypothetical protein
MQASLIQQIAAILFVIAILHTFLVKRFHRIARRYRKGSIGENLFHLLSEVEIVFGFWAAVFLLLFSAIESPSGAIEYLESRNFTEPTFVFAILAICSTQPVLDLAESLIMFLARVLPFKRSIAFLVTSLTIGPVLGSFITEPAAMTVTALVLLERFYQKGISERLKYSIIGVLFVNVSIGGTLTPYAAPPVLMVAGKWNWTLSHMMTNFGWKGILASILSTTLIAFRFRKELVNMKFDLRRTKESAPVWIKVCHLLFLGGVVWGVHHPTVVLGLFLFFLGLVYVTDEHQGPVRIRESLMVSFFLAGLVVLGGMQDWWLEPILTKLSALPLYLGAIGLTAFTDNAALTYLGSLVPTLSESSRYALVSGAVVGGGLTVIANAPNPAGYSILQPAFGVDGISPTRLLLAALPPTVIAALCFWIF